MMLKKANGDYIAFQDADDWSDLKRFEKQVEFLEQNKQIFLCGTEYRYVNDIGELECLYKLPSTHEEIIKSIDLKHVPPFCPASCMIRREVIETIGGFRDYFDRIASADFDWIYMIIEKYSVANLEDILYFYRKNYNSVTLSYSSDIRKYISYKIAYFFHIERINNAGKDSLWFKDMTKVNIFIKSNLKEYYDDPSLNYRQLAFQHLHKRHFLKSLYFISIAATKNILFRKNYSLFKYILWKIFIDRKYDERLRYFN